MCWGNRRRCDTVHFEDLSQPNQWRNVFNGKVATSNAGKSAGIVGQRVLLGQQLYHTGKRLASCDTRQLRDKGLVSCHVPACHRPKLAAAIGAHPVLQYWLQNRVVTGRFDRVKLEKRLPIVVRRAAAPTDSAPQFEPRRSVSPALPSSLSPALPFWRPLR